MNRALPFCSETTRLLLTGQSRPLQRGRLWAVEVVGRGYRLQMQAVQPIAKTKTAEERIKSFFMSIPFAAARGSCVLARARIALLWRLYFKRCGKQVYRITKIGPRLAAWPLGYCLLIVWGGSGLSG